MKVGDLVRVTGVPPGLPKDEPGADLCTKLVFERSVGHSFPIIDILDGLVELEVGAVMGVAAYLHSIWIEPAFLVPDDKQDEPAHMSS